MSCGIQLFVRILGKIAPRVVAVQGKISPRQIAQRTKVELPGDIGAGSPQGGIQRRLEGHGRDSGNDLGKSLD
jgi:hypothetical protein